MITLRYDRGSILILGEIATPYGRWDPRVGAFRAMAMHYKEILSYLNMSRVSYRDDAVHPPPVPTLSSGVNLRPYQEAALDAWFNAEKKGVIVLPTGAGKTYIALRAIEMLNMSTLVIVPTLDLLDQWIKHLSHQFKIEIGVYGGGEERLEPLAVSTYDSAFIRAEELGDKFMLLIFDEVHHLPAPSYSQIAEMYVAPYRLGLTATYERDDGGHSDLPRLIGGCVYRLSVDALAGTYLSQYTYEKMLVDLTRSEREIYDREYGLFKGYLQSKRLRLRSPYDFRRFIMSTGRDPLARKALLARNNAIKTALNSESKINTLGEQLASFKDEKALIFTRYNQLVYRISRLFLIPAITHMTPREERKEILEKFKRGEYRAIVTSQVLDEGIDVPDASLAFILSGTGSNREYVQRLGRILRKKEGKSARLIEIVSRETVETRMSYRRHR